MEYGTHNVNTLSTAFAKAVRAAESDKYDRAARDMFRQVARLIWESCGSNSGQLSHTTAETLGIPISQQKQALAGE
jgi:hypothetical protein